MPNSIRLEVIAQPAPRTLRPLANITNPYPYGCSVLCNHPRDPELKDVVWRSGLWVIKYLEITIRKLIVLFGRI